MNDQKESKPNFGKNIIHQIPLWLISSNTTKNY